MTLHRQRHGFAQVSRTAALSIQEISGAVSLLGGTLMLFNCIQIFQYYGLMLGLNRPDMTCVYWNNK